MQQGCQCLIECDTQNNPRVLILPSTHSTSHPLAEHNVKTDPALLSINTNPVCHPGQFRMKRLLKCLLLQKISTIKHSMKTSLFSLRNRQTKRKPLFCSALILFLLPLKPGCHTEILKQRLQLQHDKTVKTMVHVWGTHEVTAKDRFSELEINLNALMIH